jgi:hypothetical protein
VFDRKEKPAKPMADRKCPIFHIGGSSASGCIGERCTMWQDEAGACAFNVIAQQASRAQ